MTRRICLSLVLLLVAITAPQLTQTKDQVDVASPVSNGIISHPNQLNRKLGQQEMQVVKRADEFFQTIQDQVLSTCEITSRLMEPFFPFKMPYLPTILNVSSEVANVSLCLTQLELQVEKPLCSIHPTPPLKFSLTFPHITLISDPYIAGGRANSLPFVGKDRLNVTVRNFNFGFSFQVTAKKPRCPKPGSTEFFTSEEEFSVNFANLNPNTRTGDLINHFLSSLGTDICEALNKLLNGKLHDAMDKFVISLMDDIIDVASNGKHSCKYQSQFAGMEGIDNDEETLAKESLHISELIRMLGDVQNEPTEDLFSKLRQMVNSLVIDVDENLEDMLRDGAQAVLDTFPSYLGNGNNQIYW